MGFNLSWSTPYGTRMGFTAATAREAIDEVAKRNLSQETPGLKIKDAAGVTLKLQQLALLAAQQEQTKV